MEKVKGRRSSGGQGEGIVKEEDTEK